MPWLFLGGLVWLLSSVGEESNIIHGRYRDQSPMGPRDRSAPVPTYAPMDRYWL